VYTSGLRSDRIQAALSAENGVHFNTAENEGSSPARSTNVAIYVNVSVGEQQAVLELVLHCDRAEQLSASSSASSVDSVDLTHTNGALLTTDNVLRSILCPSLPSVSVLQAACSHLISAHITHRKHVSSVNILDGAIDRKKQRISLLAKVMSLLTSEGNKETVLLQSVQDALRHVAGISQSTITCRDVVTDCILYDATMVYGLGGEGNITTSGSGVTSLGASLTPRTSSRVVSFIDAAHPLSHSTLYTPISTPSDPNNNSRMNTVSNSTSKKLFVNTQSTANNMNSDLITPNVYRTYENHPQNNLQSTSSSSSEVVEYVFECYEIQGTLTVHCSDQWMEGEGEGDRRKRREQDVVQNELPYNGTEEKIG
jgi:hypothetical protein